MNIADIRKDYHQQSLDIQDVSKDPFTQFKSWLEAAIKSEVLEPTAMTLSTVNGQGRPSGRIVLLKGVDVGIFQFYTNYQSRKAQELANSPWASLTFFWAELERQVRVDGLVKKLPTKVSNEYFQSRPKESKIGAHTSPQSQVIPSRAVLEEKYISLVAHYEDSEVPLPDQWGGYGLEPVEMEFWQGRASRLHDRIRYKLEGTAWLTERLAP